MHGIPVRHHFSEGRNDIRLQKTVLCHGVFDLLHLGHIRHLREAKTLGDRLVVSITADQYVQKGLNRPHFTVTERAEALKALGCVDEVFVSYSRDAVSAINHIKPNVYVKGIDYDTVADGSLEKEIKAVEIHGGRFCTTSTSKLSSTKLLNGQRFSDEVLAWLASARAKGFREQIHEAFVRADELKIVFVGETIIDEYRYVAALAKPSKEFILATVEAKPPDQFLGGAWAAQLHGDWKNTVLVTDEGDPIRKTRFVDVDFTRKLFEVYSRRKLELDEEQRGRFRSRLIAELRDSDVAVVFDFGHGLLGTIERHIVESAKFLAVNAQSNAGNYGFNPITNYRNVDYVCVDEPEAQLAVGSRDCSIEEVIVKLRQMIPQPGTFSPKLVVTRGLHGCSFLDNDMTGTVPPFAAGGLDTMGAGDAFLAVSSPLLAAGLSLEAAAFVGNVAGAIKVSILGHARHVGRDELLKTVDGLLA